MNNIVTSGKRKTAVAKATIKAGTGKITINKIPLDFYPELNQLEVKEPILIAEQVIGKPNYDIAINVRGSGMASRIEASRLAIARAIIAFSKSVELKQTYVVYDRNMLVADTRRKEPYKPGDSRARAKRQKSYR
jgi:small subunit ribosomal protein S9